MRSKTEPRGTDNVPTEHFAEKRSLLEESPYICQCFGIDEDQLVGIVESTRCYDFDQLRTYYQVGSRCTSCEVEVRDVLYELQQGRGEILSASSIPLQIRAKKAVRQAKARAKFWLRDVLKVPRRFGLFVVRGDGFESELVLSNIRFPEDEANPNGPQVRFDTYLYNGDGKLLALRKDLRLQENHSFAYGSEILARGAPKHFHGTLFVHFYGLAETGSLRPYCRLKYDYRNGAYQSSCHYHDQFTTRKHYQHIINTHPMQRGRTGWVALSNPVAEPYQSRAYLQAGDETFCAEVLVPPKGALWSSFEALFGVEAENMVSDNVHFWLEGDGPMMAWFFWHSEQHNVWVAQHK